MRIAIYANITPDEGGGAATYLAALIKALGMLKEHDDEYMILGSSRGSQWLGPMLGPRQRLVVIPQQRSPYRFPVRALRYAFRTATRGFNAIAKSKNGHIDAVERQITHAVVSIGGAFFSGLKADVIHFPFQKYVITSIPSVYNPHDLQHLHFPQFFAPETISRREICFPIACRLAARIVVASNWIAEDISEKYVVPRQKIAVIPWGAATSAYAEPDQSSINRCRILYGLPDRFIVYPAIAWPHKNHIRLLEAMAVLQSRGEAVSLVLTGERMPLTGQLEDLVERLGLKRVVRFVGFVAAEDMRALYRASTMVVVPTLFEAASGPIYDAWQEHVPVACSDIPQLRDQADGAAVFFDPYSAESIAESIQKVLASAAVRAELVTAGRSRIEQLTWERTALKYRNVYHEAAAGQANQVRRPSSQRRECHALDLP